jgi:hypothetical protein
MDNRARDSGLLIVSTLATGVLAGTLKSDCAPFLNCRGHLSM